MRLIINADDFGLSKSVNDAVKELCKLGTISSTSVMANMPFASEIKEILAFTHIGIGLHVNLTQGYPVSPVTDIKSIIDSDGKFFPKDKLEILISQGKVEYAHILTEVSAQYYALRELIGERLDHFDSHQGSTRIKMVSDALIELSKKEGLNRRIRVHSKYYLSNSATKTEILEPNIFSINHFGIKRVIVEYLFRRKREYWRKSFKSPEGMLFTSSHKTADILTHIANLENPPSSKQTFEVSCHPATDHNDLTDTKMLEERVHEYNLLKSESFKKNLSHVELITFSDL